MIAVSPDASSSPAAAVNMDPKATNLDVRAAERDAERQSNREITQSTGVTAPLSSFRTGDLPIEGSAPVGPAADTRTEMSHTLDAADGAMGAVKTWKSAVHVIKQVMDHVGPIVTVCLTSSSVYHSLS
jgi:hypothetical protein